MKPAPGTLLNDTTSIRFTLVFRFVIVDIQMSRNSPNVFKLYKMQDTNTDLCYHFLYTNHQYLSLHCNIIIGTRDNLYTM